ncbi:MAG: hypothetical protein AABX32_07835 [Nanoarchaeota archaeon]
MVVTPHQFGQVVDLLGEPSYLRVTYQLPIESGDLGRLVTDTKELFGQNTKIGRSIDLTLEVPKDPFKYQPVTLTSGVDTQMLKKAYEASLRVVQWNMGDDDSISGVFLHEGKPQFTKNGVPKDAAVYHLREVGWSFEVGTLGMEGVLNVRADYKGITVNKSGKSHAKEEPLIALLKAETITSTIHEDIPSH